MRSWYVAATPELGITAVRGAYGLLVTSDRVALERAVLTIDAASSVPDALAEATEVLGTDSFEVLVDDRDRARRLAGALRDAGFESVQTTVVLALVGSVHAGPGPTALRVEDVDDDDDTGLRTWATVKLRGFSDGEDPLPSDLVRQEMSARRAEWPVCHYQVAYSPRSQRPCSATTPVRTRWCSSSPPGSRSAASASPRTCSPDGVDVALAERPDRCSSTATTAAPLRCCTGASGSPTRSTGTAGTGGPIRHATEQRVVGDVP